MKKKTERDEVVELACSIGRLLGGKKIGIALDALVSVHNAILQAGLEQFRRSSYPKSERLE